MAGDKETLWERLALLESNLEEVKTAQQKMQAQMDTMMENSDDDSLTWEEDGRMVVIAHDTTIIRISAASLTDTDPKVSNIDLYDLDNNGDGYEPTVDMMSFCATTCHGPRVYCLGGELANPDSKSMYCYDLLDLSKSHRCSPAPFTPIKPLMVQVGESVYFLNVLLHDGSLTFVKYRPEKDLWDNLPSILINKGVHYPPRISHWLLDEAPHVVIGHKLHISLLNASGKVSSFAFDTKNQAWEYSHLFDTYWSATNHSPSNFYGGKVWSVHYHEMCFPDGVVKKKRARGSSQPRGVGKKKRTRGSSQPFGFYGKGIMWGEDVLLGLHRFSKHCKLIAFQLDEMGSVVDSQPFASSELTKLTVGRHLVDIDLDGSGLFGIVHFRNRMGDIELLTCKIQRASQVKDGSGRTFSIKVLKAHAVAESPFDMGCNSNVFSVGSS